MSKCIEPHLNALTQDFEKSYHPKTAPKIGCLIGWLTKLRGHVTYDQTVDVMLLESMARNFDYSQQKYDYEFTFNKYMTSWWFI